MGWRLWVVGGVGCFGVVRLRCGGKGVVVVVLMVLLVVVVRFGVEGSVMVLLG